MRRSRLADIRNKRGVSQSTIAKSMGISAAAVSQLESRNIKKLDTLAKYIAATGGRLDIRALYDDAVEPVYNERVIDIQRGIAYIDKHYNRAMERLAQYEAQEKTADNPIEIDYRRLLTTDIDALTADELLQLVNIGEIARWAHGDCPTGPQFETNPLMDGFDAFGPAEAWLQDHHPDLVDRYHEIGNECSITFHCSLPESDDLISHYRRKAEAARQYARSRRR